MFRILYRELTAICLLSVCALAGEYDGDFADSIILANEATVGTVQYHLATTVLASPLQVQHSLAGGQVALGICIQNCGKTGRARILVVGQASCEFDGPVTARNFFQISPTVDGLCHDAGPSYPSHGKVGGLIVETHATAGIYPVILFSIGVQGGVGTPLIPVGNFLRDDGTWQSTPIGSIPSGMIMMLLSGTCPGGFTEATALNGKFLQGTLAANGDVGTTGGNATITPTGTVSQPTFSGNPITAVINHTHPVTITDPGHTHTERAQGSTPASTTGANLMTSTATGGSLRNSAQSTVSSTTGITASSSNPAGGVASITPAGTVSQPVFTGNAVDPRPQFTRVIFCAAN